MTPDPICGLCRRALRHGESHELVRVAPADLSRDVLERCQCRQVRPAGLYALCADCVAVLKPLAQHRVAAARSTADHVVKPEDVDGHDLI